MHLGCHDRRGLTGHLTWSDIPVKVKWCSIHANSANKAQEHSMRPTLHLELIVRLQVRGRRRSVAGVWPSSRRSRRHHEHLRLRLVRRLHVLLVVRVGDLRRVGLCDVGHSGLHGDRSRLLLLGGDGRLRVMHGRHVRVHLLLLLLMLRLRHLLLHVGGGVVAFVALISVLSMYGAIAVFLIYYQIGRAHV